MDDSYFTEEINYLLEMGREFARKHPDKAKMVQLDNVRSREPNLERLFENFAFLSSRIRKELDDDFSWLAHELLTLLWPGCNFPVPSMCIVELLPQIWNQSTAEKLPRGVLMDSEAQEDNVSCRFRTCFATSLLPIELSRVDLFTEGGKSNLVFSFALSNQVKLDSFHGHKLRLQICGGEPMHRWQLYNLLLGKDGNDSNVGGISLKVFDEGERPIKTRNFAPRAISPVGLSPEESLLDDGDNPLWTFNLVRDFFVFPEKFQAFELNVLDPLTNLEEVERFEIEVTINRQWPSKLPLSKMQFLPNTVPVANLFQYESEPISPERTKLSYKVLPAENTSGNIQVHSVDNVVGIDGIANSKREFKYLTEYYTRVSSEPVEDIFYTLEENLDSSGQVETNIKFFNLGKGDGWSSSEIVKLDLTCNNGHLPSKLPENHPFVGATHLDESVTIKNVTRPTEYFVPDVHKTSIWRRLSYAVRSDISFASSKKLQTVLELCDTTGDRNNLLKVESIKNVSVRTERAFLDGMIMPCVALEVTVDESGFIDFGEIQLLAQVLSVFATAYISTHACVGLKVIVEPSGQKIILPPRVGQVFPL